MRGAPIAMAMVAAPGIAGSQLLNNAWLTCAGLAGTADPVRTRPRRHQFSQRGPGGANRLRLPQKLWQLRDIGRDPPRLIARCSQHAFCPT
jgi:hypothetical protein